IAVDSQGRIWVWAQRLNADGSFTMMMSVSTDGGATFAAQPAMDSFATRPGGRIMAIGGNRLMLLYSAQGGQPGYMRIRSDADALSAWSARQLVFSVGICHGATLSAGGDGTGGFKGYPAAAEILPSIVPAVACVYGNTPDASSAGVASLVFAPTPGGIASPPPPPPPPPPPSPSSGVLFSDDFNRSNSADL